MKTIATQSAPAEPEFLLATQRLARAPTDKVAIIVHLSRLRQSRAALPPAHQLRLARSILSDAAQRYEGQVFTLRNGDMALLCRHGGRPVEAAGTLAVEPATLPGVLSRLFHADTSLLVSVWPLPTQRDSLLAYAADRLAEVRPAAASHNARPAGQASQAASGPLALANRTLPGSPSGSSAADASGSTATIDAISTLLAGTRLTDLMHRQTAIRLSQQDGTVQPLFRELSFSVSALEQRIAGLGQPGQAGADPFLFRHLAARLDTRMLATLLSQIGRGGPLDAAASGSGPGLHLNLTLPTIRSEAFTRLLSAVGQADGQLGIEVSFVEVCADPAAWRHARELTARHGVTLVLDGVSPLALRLTRPWLLQPDLVKFEWLPRLPTAEGIEQAQINEGIEMLDPNRIVLHRAETEAALAWGQAHGISRFQGRHVDAMLGAGRILHCPLSRGCTLRQCIERGAAIADVGRSGCGNVAMLDGADVSLRGGRRPDTATDMKSSAPTPEATPIPSVTEQDSDVRRRRGASRS
jgi:hypothetical protein